MEKRDWEQIAKEFTDRVFQVTDHDTHGLIRQTARKLGTPSKHAGDFGCGPGAVTRLLAPNFGQVTGIDQAGGLIQEAQQATTAKNVTFIQADLTTTQSLGTVFDVSFCVNVLINRNHQVREKICRTIAAHTRKGGTAVFVVPSFESMLRVYQTVVDCQVNDSAGRILAGRKTAGRNAAVRSVTRQLQSEVESVIDGIVTVGGSPTKHFLADELAAFLGAAGFQVRSIQRVEYPWEEELDDPPPGLGSPTPWDWMAECRRKL
jgi:2-polyprenyl-3-methyl-5-hydroxy-6-metoxy-1,4-benzoquinol methylase